MRMQARGEDLLAEYVNRLARAYPRSTIVLFGSRARGDNLPYSDYDIAIILPDEECGDKLEETIRARRLKPRGISVDVLVLCASELDEDPLVKQMLRDAKTLYAPRH